MFEFRVALKYLIPKWRQLSVSIISLISIFVIALVVWLLVVFFSVTWGLEKGWIQKVLSLAAPIRITPTEAYYDSYYYKIDAVSQESGWNTKTLGQKRKALLADPYDPNYDEGLPQDWPSKDLAADGSLKDPVKELFAAIETLPEAKASEFQLAAAELTLIVQKDKGLRWNTFLHSYDPENNNLAAMQEIQQTLPRASDGADGILVPKGFKDSGASVGDQGVISYKVPTASGIREQKIPIYVVGFYDPGLLSIGNRTILTNTDIAQTVAAFQPNEKTNGINVRFDNLDHAHALKQKLVNELEKRGVSTYWNIETFREFEFSKDLLQQLNSERNLFSLIATLIILVACSNIISMLIILVNDKKKEIGILRAMGASSLSIAMIFGSCGFAMGAAGSLLGIGAAAITLQNLQSLINLISRLQGFDAFNPVFFGDTLPNQLSPDALGFVLGATALISLTAGLVPALKACSLKPSNLLRAE